MENIKQTQDSQAWYYNAKHKYIDFVIGDKVWLLTPNIRTKRPSKKLDWKCFGPYAISEWIGLQTYRLDLSFFMKIHPIFHISLLESYKASIIPERTREPSSSIVIDNEEEWEIEEILDSELCHRKLWYKIRWAGYSLARDSWQSASDLINCPDLVKQFHIHYPSKSSQSIR